MSRGTATSTLLGTGHVKQILSEAWYVATWPKSGASMMVPAYRVDEMRQQGCALREATDADWQAETAPASIPSRGIW